MTDSTAESPIEYRRATAADIDGFLSLYRDTFDPEEGTRAWFEWQYETLSQLAGDEPSVTVATADGAVVGAVGFLGTTFRAPGDQTFLGIQPVNGMVDPAYHGQGVFSTIITESRANLYPTDRAWVEYGYPNEVALRIWRSKLQWQTVRTEPDPRYIRLQYPTKYAAGSVDSRLVRALRSIGDLPVQAALRWQDRRWRGDQGTGPAVTRYDEPPIELLAELYRDAPPSAIHLERSEDYYDVRLDRPHTEYVTYVAESSDGPIAALVVARAPYKSYVHIIEALPMGARTERIDAALKQALIAAVTDNRSASGIVWSPALPRELLAQFGFHTAPRFQEAAERYLPDVLGERIPSIANRNFCILAEDTDFLDTDPTDIDNWWEAGIEKDL